MLVMRRVAITGGIAEGKSTVLGYLSSLGYKTLSADALARELFDEDSIQKELAALLGVEPPVQRSDLLRAIAAKPSLRRAVNRLFHPYLLPRLLDGGAEFIEIPLLIETCLQGLFDEVWVVTCGPDEQMRRLAARVGPREAVQLLAAQLPTQAKIPFADVIVRTNEPEERVLAHVRRHAFERAV